MDRFSLLSRWQLFLASGHLAIYLAFYWQAGNSIAACADFGSDVDDGFVSMFDGRSLDGWKAVPEQTAADWSIDNGVIVGTGSQDRQSYLAWRDRELKDFEFRFQYRLLTNGNTGVEVRAIPDPTGRRPFQGYHADIGHVDIGPNVLGAWDFHFGKQRKEHACPRGTSLVIDDQDKPQTTSISDSLTAHDVRSRDWNDVRVIVQGNHGSFSINGKQASEFTDSFHPEQFAKGAIGLQLHDRGMRVEFRNLRIRKTDTPDPIRIGIRRELFIDESLIASLKNARRQLHHPVAREIAIVHDAPWEGAGSAYHTLIRDGDLYRLYYRGSSLGVENGRLKVGKEVYCYAESRDGLSFTKPMLGLFDHGNSKDNNIIWTGVGTHNFAPFLDRRPDCPASSRYKALGGLHSDGGLFAFHSADGKNWSLMRDKPVVTKGAFDSQNLAFWDDHAGVYRAYFRTFTAGVTTDKEWKPEGFRAIRTATSRDFLTWENEADLTYQNSPVEHLYTNQIAPYPRAPHILIGFPARYVERGWSESMRALPELSLREERAAAHLRYGTALTEGLIMSSRDGVHFERWNEAFLRPGPERPNTWLYGHQYIVWNTAITKSALPGAPDELSLYASEGSWHGNGNEIRRYTLRLDGFVSVNAPMTGGELITHPLQFSGDHLQLNFATSAAGDIRVEIQDLSGQAIPGFALSDSSPIFGDSVERRVSWSNGSDLSQIAGRPVRLRFVLRDADLFSFRFQNRSEPN